MTKYLSGAPFSVSNAGNSDYARGWDAVDWSNSAASVVPSRGNIQSMVRQFHEIYGQPIAPKPGVPAKERVVLRLKLIAEEFFELLAACGLDDPKRLETVGEVDLVGVADALADLSYVIEGANLEFGIDSQAVLEEVHRSNCSKIGADGKPVYNSFGKVVKGPNYNPPDIARVLGVR